MIYYYLDETMPLYALLAYAKNAKEDMTADEKRIVASLAAALKAAWRETKSLCSSSSSSETSWTPALARLSSQWMS